MNDLGFFAHQQNGEPGFTVYAAGGLGSNPAIGVLLEDFITPTEIFEVAEASSACSNAWATDQQEPGPPALRSPPIGPRGLHRRIPQERAHLKKDGLPEAIPETRPAARIHHRETGATASIGSVGFCQSEIRTG